MKGEPVYETKLAPPSLPALCQPHWHPLALFLREGDPSVTAQTPGPSLTMSTSGQVTAGKETVYMVWPEPTYGGRDSWTVLRVLRHLKKLPDDFRIHHFTSKTSMAAPRTLTLSSISRFSRCPSPTTPQAAVSAVGPLSGAPGTSGSPWGTPGT